MIIHPTGPLSPAGSHFMIVCAECVILGHPTPPALYTTVTHVIDVACTTSHHDSLGSGRAEPSRLLCPCPSGPVLRMSGSSECKETLSLLLYSHMTGTNVLSRSCLSVVEVGV